MRSTVTTVVVVAVLCLVQIAATQRCLSCTYFLFYRFARASIRHEKQQQQKTVALAVAVAAAKNQFRLHTASSIEATETGLNR